ncbi:PTS sugar transporter subunit IIA [Vagococcus zengguangii]|uniref:PTS sugar transporter subunit IIA n=1 Tax=Vagococcus zengguangii TaxID=2571750 RepID=A0A4D7CTH5_9ENTE|nr:PTS sugar transporter subunit IIA [Vagococcus zengguangii]QCI85720.1 PTS sugar transporter subunit IIA [Vagococcus zengguangii]TLG81661.1 PTS sugar transporter subunit IIA [Vagococcus zengguangii]
MADIIITGHGNFAQGMKHAVEMIMGEQEKIKEIPFIGEEPLESFSNNLKQSVNTSLENNQEIIVFTDLKGGTPFNQSMLLHMESSGIYVVGGTNLAMLIEAISLNMSEMKTEIILEKVINSSKDSIYSSLDFSK